MTRSKKAQQKWSIWFRSKSIKCNNLYIYKWLIVALPSKLYELEYVCKCVLVLIMALVYCLPMFAWKYLSINNMDRLYKTWSSLYIYIYMHIYRCLWVLSDTNAIINIFLGIYGKFVTAMHWYKLTNNNKLMINIVYKTTYRIQNTVGTPLTHGRI